MYVTWNNVWAIGCCPDVSDMFCNIGLYTVCKCEINGHCANVLCIPTAVELAEMKPFKIKVLWTYVFYVTILIMRNIKST